MKAFKLTIKATVYLVLLFTDIKGFSQNVGINTTGNRPDTSAMLDVASTTKGMLTPRMTTTQRTTIYSPANGLFVYDTDLSGFYYYKGSEWVKIEAASDSRTNYVLVKSASDFPAPVGGVITLVTGTLYEINGAVTLSSKIDLSGCSLTGRDLFSDKLIYTGSAELFTGSNVGDISNLTLTANAGSVFNINAGGSNNNFLIRNCNFVGSNNIGTLQGVGGILYISNIGYFNNTNGFTFQNDNFVYLNNSFWDISNHNVYEKFVGVFNIIEILGGNCIVSSGNAAKAISITGITSLTNGSIKSVLFSGTDTYISGSFSNAWEVEGYGLNTEKDNVATGNLYVSTIASTIIATINTPVKVAGLTTSANLFRATSPIDNRLTYIGTRTRSFKVSCSLTASAASNNQVFSFYIAKNGTILPESKQTFKLTNNTDQNSLTISCTVSLAVNDYIEVWVENNTSSTDISVKTLNLAID